MLINVVSCLLILLKITAPLVQPLLTDCVDKPPMEAAFLFMGKEKICGIYKITSPTKRVYIGQSININHRFYLYRNLRCNKQPKLYRSLKRHSPDKHKFEILHLCERIDLDKLEEYYISLFNSTHQKHGMNVRTGGHYSKMTPMLRQKLSRIKSTLFKNNKSLYERTVKQINSVEKSGRNNPIYGTGRSFMKFDKNLNLVSEYKSLFDLLQDNYIGKIYVYRCCARLPRYKTAKGFIWRFKDDSTVIDGKLVENIVVVKRERTSKFKGVRFLKKDKVWMASVWSPEKKKFIYLGRFKKETDANLRVIEYKNMAA